MTYEEMKERLGPSGCLSIVVYEIDKLLWNTSLTDDYRFDKIQEWTSFASQILKEHNGSSQTTKRIE